MNPDLQAVVFDVDGVLSDTAELHYEAWSALFGEILEPTAAPFDRSDYHRLVDGRARLDGLQAVLADRDVLGRAGYEQADVATYAERKQELYLEILQRAGVVPFDDVVRCLDRLARLHIRTAAASASRNARPVLRAARLLDRFEVVVDGTDAARLELASKPEPDLFLATAEQLELPPSACALVEDAVSGVRAGRAGGFGLVVGLDRRLTGRADLRDNADLVIASLDELPLDGY